MVHEESYKVFKVGGDEIKSLMGTITLLCTIGIKHISMKLDILSKPAIKQTKIKVRVLNDTADIFGNRFELNNTSSRHSCLFNHVADVKECNISCDRADNKSNKYKILQKVHARFAHPT